MIALLVVALVLLIVGVVAVGVADDTEDGAYNLMFGLILMACALILGLLAMAIRMLS